MTTKDSLPPYSTVNIKLAEIVAQASTPPSWYESWRSLGPEATDEDRLAVYQAIRDAGSLPCEAGFYLVAWQIDMLTSEAAEEELRELDEELEAIRRAHGLDELDRWPEGQEPDDYREIERQYMAAYDDLFVRKLKQHGEHEMTRLFRTNRVEFDRLHEEGRKLFHGSADTANDELPDWLNVLLDLVAECLEFQSPAGPLGVRWGQDQDAWEVTIYPTPVELVGGASDGELVWHSSFPPRAKVVRLLEAARRTAGRGGRPGRLPMPVAAFLAGAALISVDVLVCVRICFLGVCATCCQLQGRDEWTCGRVTIDTTKPS
jgi:hypothetical protein